MTSIVLPVGSEPGWEVSSDDDDNESKFKSIHESGVLYHSLQQSRQTWLEAFPKFSCKARGSRPPLVPPSHTIHHRGKCDIKIGPHIFPDVSFSKVHYLPTQSQALPSTLSASAYTVGSWQSTTPYAAYQHPSSFTGASTFQNSPTQQAHSVQALLDSPDFMAKVAAAASSNPILSNLLQNATAGEVTDVQKSTLGAFINSCVALSLHQADPATWSAPSAAATTSPALPVQPPPKQWDIVFQFGEMPNERVILPRGPVECKRVPDDTAIGLDCDIALDICLPFDANNDSKREVASIKLLKAPSMLWELLCLWIGDAEKIEADRIIINALKKKRQQKYLGYRLEEGTFLTLVQNTVNPPPNTRPINPKQPGAVRRRSTVPRKPAVPKRSATTDGPPVNGNIPVETTTKKRKTSIAQKKSANVRATGPAIACHVCNATGVPLIFGGRFCRQCVDSGRAFVPAGASTSTSTLTPEVPDMQAYHSRMQTSALSALFNTPAIMTTSSITAPTTTSSEPFVTKPPIETSDKPMFSPESVKQIAPLESAKSPSYHTPTPEQVENTSHRALSPSYSHSPDPYPAELTDQAAVMADEEEEESERAVTESPPPQSMDLTSALSAAWNANAPDVSMAELSS